MNDGNLENNTESRPRLRSESYDSKRPIFQMRIDRKLLNRIRERARKERRSASELVRHAVEVELAGKPRA